MLLWALTLLVMVTTARGEEAETSGTLRLVRFECAVPLQMEVWMDGKRAGFTPFDREFPAGRYLLTASGEGIRPIIQHLDVRGVAAQRVVLPAAPMPEAELEGVRGQLYMAISQARSNAHTMILALELTRNAEEEEHLLRQADRFLTGDAVVSALRAAAHRRAGKPKEALAAAMASLAAADNLSAGWREKARALHDMGDEKEALSSVNEAVIREPGSWKNLELRAEIHRRLGNERAAQNDDTRAQELCRLAAEHAAPVAGS